MDDITLIGHMSGEGEAATNKLRRAGYTTLQKILTEEAPLLAKNTGLQPDTVNKIMGSAKTLSAMRPAPRPKPKPRPKPAPRPKPKPRPTPKPKAKRKKRAPALDPLKRLARELAGEHKIIESVGLKLVDVVMKIPGTKEKILREAVLREKFREKLGRNLIRSLL